MLLLKVSFRWNILLKSKWTLYILFNSPHLCTFKAKHAVHHRTQRIHSRGTRHGWKEGIKVHCWERGFAITEKATLFTTRRTFLLNCKDMRIRMIRKRTVTLSLGQNSVWGAIIIYYIITMIMEELTCFLQTSAMIMCFYSLLCAL